MVRKLRICPAETQTRSANNNIEGEKNKDVTQTLLEVCGTDLADCRFWPQHCARFSAVLSVFSSSVFFFFFFLSDT